MSGPSLSRAKVLALIGLGYVASVAGGVAAVVVVDMLIRDDVKDASGGMVAFGEMIVFVLATGVLSLVPTWFLLKLCVATIPRALVAAELLIAATGPLSWLAVRDMATGASPQGLPQALVQLLGLLIPLVAMPRMAFGPVLLVTEAATFVLMRERSTRALLVGAMLMDLVPLAMFALHIAAALPR